MQEHDVRTHIEDFEGHDQVHVYDHDNEKLKKASINDVITEGLRSTAKITPTSTTNSSTYNNTSSNSTVSTRMSPSVRNSIAQTIRILFATIYLIYIILTIPLSFEVGGLNCGLSYSLTIILIYFGLATFRILKYHRFISSFLYYLQHLLLPTLLSFCLSIFSDPEMNGINIYWLKMIQVWKIFLINSTPLFTILEGFCSLLSIQAIGQLFKYFIKDKSSDVWLIINLIISSCILSTSFYFAGKIYVSPLLDLETVGFISASLLGSVFTLTILITFYAIYFNRATTLESSLMVAYIVKCCYELFPQLSQNNLSSLFKFVFNEFKKIDNQAKRSFNYQDYNHLLNEKVNWLTGMLREHKFFNFLFHSNASFKKIQYESSICQIAVSYFEIFKNFNQFLFNSFVEHFPRSFEPLWDFFKISINNLTFSILMQLAYRILVFFSATKIIPILSPMNTMSSSSISRLIYLYSPCIIIAVYTNLMIQYNYEIDKSDHFYTWIHTKLLEWFFQITSTSTTTAPITTIIPSCTGTSSGMLSYEVNNPNLINVPFHTWQFWNWINIFAVLLLYFSELVSFDPEDSALTDHWN